MPPELPPNVVVNGTDGNDLIDATYVDAEGNRVDPGAPVGGRGPFDDVILAGAGNDTVLAGAGDDLVYGEDGDDLLVGGDGDDTLVGGDGSDTLYGGKGNDVLVSGRGDNTLVGGAGDDVLVADSDGNNVLYGDGPNDPDNPDVVTHGKDTLVGGRGDDTMYGGGGDDDFVLQNQFGNYVIYGGEEGEGPRGDLVDATGLTEGVTLRYTGNEQGTIDRDGAQVTFSEIENVYLGSGDDVVVLEAATSGVVLGGDGVDVLVVPGLGEDDENAPQVTITNTYQNPDGTTSYDGYVQFPDGSVLSFRNFEEIVPCFTPGTLIDTDQGPRPVEALSPGDRVLTRDHGYRELVWTGRKALPAAAVSAWPGLAPVRIAAGALGAGVPVRDLLVSPRHRMLVTGARAEVMFGEREVLVAAGDLVGLPGISRDAPGAVEYLHVMCAGHEILRAEGAWTESFQPEAGVLDGLGAATRAELLRVFPELSTAAGQARFAAARPVLSPAEARLLVA